MRAIRVTARFGIASGIGPSCVLDDLIERAERAIYRAKRAGRNHVEVAAMPGQRALT